MDKVALKRDIPTDYTTRYYTMTGGEFKAMVEAVKSLPSRQYDAQDKAWLVRGEGIQALRELGFTVTQDADLKHEFIETSLTDHGDGKVRITVYPAYREKNQRFKDMPSKTLVLYPTDEEIEAEKETINANIAQFGLSTKADRYMAVREIARRKCNEYFDNLLATYKAATTGKRDKDSVMAGLKAVLEVIKND